MNYYIGIISLLSPPNFFELAPWDMIIHEHALYHKRSARGSTVHRSGNSNEGRNVDDSRLWFIDSMFALDINDESNKRGQRWVEYVRRHWHRVCKSFLVQRAISQPPLAALINIDHTRKHDECEACMRYNLWARTWHLPFISRFWSPRKPR